jgi:hypothetical protein
VGKAGLGGVKVIMKREVIFGGTSMFALRGNSVMVRVHS